MRDFPGGAVVKNLPANAGDTSSIPGPGRSHMLQSNQARVPQLLSLHSRACEPQLLSPWATATEPTSHSYWAHVLQLSPRAAATEAHAPRARAPQQEKSLQWEAHEPQRRVAPARHN